MDAESPNMMVGASPREQPGLTGRRLALSLMAIAVLAFAVPPGLATWVQQRRLDRARTQLDRTLAILTTAWPRGVAALEGLQDVGVLVGPGDPIVESVDARWLSSRSVLLQHTLGERAAGLGPDPWLRPLVINVGAYREQGVVWLLSAGPNGIIDTPFVQAAPGATGGDDLAVRLP